jgi:hypothetical protein
VVGQFNRLGQVDSVAARGHVRQAAGEVVRPEQPAQHADGGLKGVDILVLVVCQAAVQPLARLGQWARQVHDHHGVKTVDNDPAQPLRAHLRAPCRDGVVPVLTWAAVSVFKLCVCQIL